MLAAIGFTEVMIVLAILIVIWVVYVRLRQQQ